MLRGSNGVKCQEWTERLERFAKSRQTVAEFCRDEGVSAPSFYQWKQKLGRVSANNTKLGKRGRRPGKPPAFKPLHVSPLGVLSGVRVRLPDGIVIDLGSDLMLIDKVVAQLLDHHASTGSDAC